MGWVSDIVGRDIVLAGLMATAAMGHGVVLVAESTLFLALGIGLIGVGISFGGVISSRIMDHLSDAERGTGFGLARTVFLLVGSLGSVVTGALADMFGWVSAFGLIIAMLLVVFKGLSAKLLRARLV